MVVILLTVCTVAITCARIAGIKTQSYQAIAHLYVGGLFGAFIESYPGIPDYFLLYHALILTLVEILCFLFLKDENKVR